MALRLPEAGSCTGLAGLAGCLSALPGRAVQVARVACGAHVLDAVIEAVPDVVALGGSTDADPGSS